MIKNIIFDLGGVIAHLTRERAVERFISIGILDAEKLLDPYLQSGIFLSLEDGSISKDEFREALSQKANKQLSHQDIKWAFMGFLAEVPQYKLDYIENLKKKYSIYILSNTNPYVMEYAESSQFSESKNPLSYYCDKKFASYEVRLVKPNKAIFTHMIETTGLTPKESLFIDDGAKNIEMANSIGFLTYMPNNFEDWRWNIDNILNK